MVLELSSTRAVFLIHLPQPETRLHDLKGHFKFYILMKDITISLMYCYCSYYFPALLPAQFNFSTLHCDAEKPNLMIFIWFF